MSAESTKAHGAHENSWKSTSRCKQTVLSSSSPFNTSSIHFGLDKKRKHAKVLFLQRKGIFHFEKQFYIKIHHCVSLPCDSLRMNFPFLCLPVDRLGQFLHFLDVQPVLCNLTSSSFGQEIGNSRVGSSKHAQTITITMTINITITIGKKTKPNQQLKNPNTNCTIND